MNQTLLNPTVNQQHRSRYTDYIPPVTLYRVMCPSVTAMQSNIHIIHTRTHTDIRTNKEKSVLKNINNIKAALFNNKMKWTGSRQTRLFSLKPFSVQFKDRKVWVYYQELFLMSSAKHLVDLDYNSLAHSHFTGLILSTRGSCYRSSFCVWYWVI